MAILKHLYIFALLFLLNMSLTSCYQTFEPDLKADPVLCMNSEITPGNPVILYLTRTWNWTENSYNGMDVSVRDADVRLYVNGEYQETLIPDEIDNGYNPGSPYPQFRPCFRSEYLPVSGDVVRLEASSPKYGKAEAEVTIPHPVKIDDIEIGNLEVWSYGDTSGFPAVEDRCEYLISYRAYVRFTDPEQSGDCYDLVVNTTPYSDFDNQATSYAYIFPDFDDEPLFTEHVSVLESAITDAYDYTIFSDRQINGKTYPLKVGLEKCEFYYRNPDNLPAPKEYGVVFQLRHIDESYYKHVISVWEVNQSISGALGGIGLADQVYPYSNVSTGAGIVAAYAVTQVTVPFVELISRSQRP